MAGYSHRSSIKNGHKGFKSRHSSKGALKRLFKGKVESTTKNGGKSGKPLSKLQRKNTSKQLRETKILNTLEERKLFGGPNGAEKLITIIPLSNDVNAEDILEKLISSADLPKDMGLSIEEKEQHTSFVRSFYVQKYKSNLKVISPDMSNFLHILDCAKVADFVIFGLSATSEVDPDFSEQIIRALELQGIASYMGVVPNLSKVHEKEKFQADVKQSLESYFSHFFPKEDRIYNLEKPSEAVNALRILCQKYPRSVQWRDNRGFIVADQIDFVDRDDEYGELVVEGTVRGLGFHANRLVHIPDFGDFQVTKIEKCRASTRTRKQQNKDKELNLDLALDDMFESNENRESLEEYAPDDLDMEQLSDEEDFEYDNLKSARYDDHGFLPGGEKSALNSKVPKGTSQYQAKWYVNDIVDVEDEEVENEDEEAEQEEDEDMIEETMDIDQHPYDEAMDEDGSQLDPKDATFVDLSAEEEERQLKEYRNLEKEDREFPDEIELEPSESAIQRLKRYRGLRSLHNCSWDVDEKDPHAPPEWKRILRISNYKNTRSRIINETTKEAQVVAGDLVRLYLKFPKNLLQKIINPKEFMCAIYGLLLHEHKNAIVNFSIQRWEEYDKPVPSKEPLIVQYGVRRYNIQPLFSSASNNPNNVHKYERYLQPDTLSIATCIAPVDFTQSPAIFFKTSSNDPKGLELVGHGTFLNTDYTRILARRIILTGHPFRFHKSVLTVRYMFFNAEDIEWFKSIPLFTKSGRSGFIKERLGTHGYFKATFDGKLSAEDVVAMSLYKRMWPRTSQPWFSK